MGDEHAHIIATLFEQNSGLGPGEHASLILSHEIVHALGFRLAQRPTLPLDVQRLQFAAVFIRQPATGHKSESSSCFSDSIASSSSTDSPWAGIADAKTSIVSSSTLRCACSARCLRC
jgi:hypothetical protein